MRNATLVYTYGAPESKEKDYNTIDLINGTPADGTYLAVIPSNEKFTNGSRVFYELHFEDALNYTSTYQNNYTIQEDLLGPTIGSDMNFLQKRFQGYNASLTFPISDNSSGVRNVVLHYNISKLPANQYDEYGNCIKYASCVNMSLIQGDKWYGIHEQEILLDSLNTTRFNYFVEAFDTKGLSSRTNISSFDIDPLPWWKSERNGPSLLNNVFLNVSMTDINLRNLIVQMHTRAEIPAVLNASLPYQIPYHFITVFNPIPYQYFVDRQPPDSFLIYLYNNSEADREYFPRNSGLTSIGRNGTFDERSEVIAAASLFADGYRKMLYLSNNPSIQNVHLIGDRSLYPFDHYYANLFFGPPGAVINIENQSVSFGDGLKSTWDPFIQNKTIFESKIPFSKGKSEFNLTLEFKRNHSILIIIIPLISIFYLSDLFSFLIPRILAAD